MPATPRNRAGAAPRHVVPNPSSQQKALQNAILTSAALSIIATDERGLIQLFNAGAERLLGYPAAEVCNRIRPSDLHDPQEVQARAEALSAEFGMPIAPGFESLAYKASRAIEDIYELTYVCKDGTRLPALVSITALRDDDGTIIGYLLVGANNSARQRVEAQLNEAIAAADKANLSKSNFLSSMSHELRTPLNAILGFAQLLQSGVPLPTPPQKRSIDQILKAGWYLLTLINEILDLALIESGKLTLSTEPTSVSEVLSECQALIESQAAVRQISTVVPTFQSPIFVSVDRTRMKQILINLLFNAIKYNTPGGSVTVEASPVGTATLRISVHNTGPGLSPSQLEQLFQPFNRLGREATAEEGTGIGLVMAKRLVEMMGGRIGARSTVGVGTEFWVEVSLANAPEIPNREFLEAESLRCEAPPGTPVRTILYVEDNPANLDLVEQLIGRRSDLRLLSAPDGDMGLEYAYAYLPDLILMDINLPGIGGIAAMKALKADARTAHIPLIAVSANAVPRDIDEALAAGFSDYITKPINVARFLAVLDGMLTAPEPKLLSDGGP